MRIYLERVEALAGMVIALELLEDFRPRWSEGRKRGGARSASVQRVLSLERLAMPGPKPNYQPRFSPEALERCREIVRQHHASHIHVQRAKLALLLAEHPAMATAEIARRLGTGTSFVWVWRKRWTVEGFSLDDRPRPGRPPSLASGDPPQGQNGQSHNGQSGNVGAVGA